MAYVPHMRLTMSGKLGGANGPEIFSMNLSLANGTDAGIVTQWPGDWEPNNTVFDDLAADCVAWFGNGYAGISNLAVLQNVKVAHIGADGRYTRPPVERAVNQSGGSGGGYVPFSVARVVTLHTTGDLGRVKGRFYAPLPSITVQNDGRWAAADVDAAEAADQTFINNINNQPGIDVLDLRVVVASQGRHNSDGSVRVPAANHVVNQISVGRVPDTQRRRRNKLLEAKTAVAVG